MMAGRPPFCDESHFGIYQRVLTGKASASIDWLLCACLAVLVLLCLFGLLIECYRLISRATWTIQHAVWCVHKLLPTWAHCEELR